MNEISAVRNTAERDPLLDTEEAARYLTLSPRTLEKWRKEGSGGPAFVKMGRRTVRYLVSALDSYIATSAASSTTEASATSRALRFEAPSALSNIKPTLSRRVRLSR